jgi:hypothetical protein
MFPRMRDFGTIAYFFGLSELPDQIICFACSLLCSFVAFVLLSYAASSASARFILVFFSVFAGIFIQLGIFCRLAKNTILLGQEAILGLSLDTLFHKSGPDERQVAVRNTAYYRAYRVVAAYLLIMPVPSGWVTGEAALNKVLLGHIALLFILVYTLPQAIILLKANSRWLGRI